MSTGRHLDRLPHRLAAERTLEPSLWLFQELVIKPGHRYRFRGCLFWCRPSVKRVQMSSRCLLCVLPPPPPPCPLKWGYLAAQAFKPMRGSYHVPSAAAERSGSREASPARWVLPQPRRLAATRERRGPVREAQRDGHRSVLDTLSLHVLCSGVNAWPSSPPPPPPPQWMQCTDRLSTMHNSSVC